MLQNTLGQSSKVNPMCCQYECRVPWLLWRHWKVSWRIPHCSIRQCQPCHTWTEHLSIHYVAHMKGELNKLEKLGVIKPISKLMGWVFLLTYQWKANDKLWLCLEPKELNLAISHFHHWTPVFEDISLEFTLPTLECSPRWKGNLVITVSCSTIGSSFLMIFSSLFSHYHYLCQSFRLVFLQDIFQHNNDQTLECCEGIIGIADEFCINGCHEGERDTYLHSLMLMTFFGCMYNGAICHPSLVKVAAIHNVLLQTNMTKFPREGDIYGSFHTTAVDIHCTTALTTACRFQLHIKQCLPGWYSIVWNSLSVLMSPNTTMMSTSLWQHRYMPQCMARGCSHPRQ